MIDSHYQPSRLTDVAHRIVADALPFGGTAIDATAGNGYDTLFLAHRVGPQGRVYAFDIQMDALAGTAAKLEKAGIGNVTLHHGCHSRLDEVVAGEVTGKVNAVMFNLGYLPGGDKSLVTREVNTIVAIEASLGLLDSGGVVTVVAYCGHRGGQEEADAVTAFAERLAPGNFRVTRHVVDSTRGAPPELTVIHKL